MLQLPQPIRRAVTRRPPLRLVRSDEDVLMRHERTQEVANDWLFQMVGPQARVRLLREHGLA